MKKNKTLMKWIDSFVEDNESITDRHIDQFVRKVKRSTWLIRIKKIAEEGSIYIKEKPYDIELYIGIELRHKRSFFEPTILKTVDLTEMPPFILLSKDKNFYLHYRYSAFLSKNYGKRCYYWQYKSSGWINTILYIRF